MNTLFTPVTLGALALSNRIIMAPMTRSRADDSGVPKTMVAEYYTQRSSAGLIISEGLYPSLGGKGYVRTPGIFTPEQIEGWQRVTAAVHAQSGKIVAQLMHCGRMAHPEFTHGMAPMAPSAIKAEMMVWTNAGQVPAVTPHAMTVAEIKAVIAAYVDAAKSAMLAGFDGIELHVASGYLPEQFLSSGSNQRQDEYGGEAAHRVRFVIELLDAVAAVVGAERMGIKIAPEMNFNDIVDAHPLETYSALIAQLNSRNLAYLHIMQVPNGQHDYVTLLRTQYQGNLIVGGGLTKTSAMALMDGDQAEAAVFGSAFIANPDLVARLVKDAPLANADPNLFYSAEKEGYIDYPALP